MTPVETRLISSSRRPALLISLSPKGLTTGEIQAHLVEVFGTDVSREAISKITDAVLEDMASWLMRPLDRGVSGGGSSSDPRKVRDGQVANRAFYCAIGVIVEGERDILRDPGVPGRGGASFCLNVLNRAQEPGRGRCVHRVL